jgi:hypothetical protein
MKLPFSLLVFCIILLGVGLSAQSLVLDPTFQSHFDFRTTLGPIVGDIYENPPDGRIYVAGNFSFHNGQTPYSGSLCYNRNGSLYTSFQSLGAWGPITRVNDSILYIHDYLRDTLGNVLNNNIWKLNRLKTVRCGWGNLPFFFKDGPALIANGKDNWGVPCNIINPPDTFPGRIIIKLTPTGLWDSTFTPDASGSPRRFTRYDSNRIIISGYTKILLITILWTLMGFAAFI